ncbi:hypothetical protein BVX98_05850 [bacterium F11]|nr:hypothetical protein BVX98_05850 [bacterium F11]
MKYFWIVVLIVLGYIFFSNNESDEDSKKRKVRDIDYYVKVLKGSLPKYFLEAKVTMTSIEAVDNTIVLQYKWSLVDYDTIQEGRRGEMEKNKRFPAMKGHFKEKMQADLTDFFCGQSVFMEMFEDGYGVRFENYTNDGVVWQRRSFDNKSCLDRKKETAKKKPSGFIEEINNLQDWEAQEEVNRIKEKFQIHQDNDFIHEMTYNKNWRGLLLGLKANYDIPSTILNSVVLSDSSEIIDEFIKAGYDVNSKGRGDWTPLLSAAQGGRNISVNKLISEGAYIDAQDTKGSTALMLSARSGCIKCVKSLMVAGADISIEDNEGKTAFSYARHQNRDGIKELLKKEGLYE